MSFILFLLSTWIAVGIARGEVMWNAIAVYWAVVSMRYFAEWFGKR